MGVGITRSVFSHQACEKPNGFVFRIFGFSARRELVKVFQKMPTSSTLTACSSFTPTHMPTHPSKITENKKAFQCNIGNLLAVM